MFRKRFVIPFVFLLFFSALSVSAGENIERHFTTDYEIHAYGSYVDGINNLLLEDQLTADFLETKYTVTGDTSNFAVDTDALSNWVATAGISSLSVDDSLYIEGTGSIKGVVSDKTNIEFAYDGNLNWDVANVKEYNVSINCDGETTITGLHLHYDDSTYWKYEPNLVIPANAWTNLTLDIADFTPVNGMSAEQAVNELAFHFTQASSNQIIWIDDCNLIGKQADDIERRMSLEFDFSGLPQKDFYQAKIIGRYNFTSDYQDDFFTEDETDWSGDTGITMAKDGIDVQEGTYRMKAIYDASQNATFWYDNATTKNMQVDWSDYTLIHQWVWGNDSFVIDYGRFYTDENNYYHADVGVTYTTTPRLISVPLGVFTPVGSPSRSNISWIEWKINNIDNPNPVEIYFDDIHLTDADSISIYTDCPDNGAAEITHSHNVWQTVTINLCADTIGISATATITLNDTLHVGDGFNTTFEIDTLYIESWNGGAVSGGPVETTTPTVTTPTTPTEREITVRPLPVTLIIGGGIAIIIAAIYEERKKKQ